MGFQKPRKGSRSGIVRARVFQAVGGQGQGVVIGAGGVAHVGNAVGAGAGSNEGSLVGILAAVGGAQCTGITGGAGVEVEGDHRPVAHLRRRYQPLAGYGHNQGAGQLPVGDALPLPVSYHRVLGPLDGVPHQGGSQVLAESPPPAAC